MPIYSSVAGRFFCSLLMFWKVRVKGKFLLMSLLSNKAGRQWLCGFHLWKGGKMKDNRVNRPRLGRKF